MKTLFALTPLQMGIILECLEAREGFYSGESKKDMAWLLKVLGTANPPVTPETETALVNALKGQGT